MPETPAPPPRNAAAADSGRPRSLREELQEAVNKNIVGTVEQGMNGIDQAKARGLAELERRGITGMEEIADSAATLFKRLLLRGISK